MNISEKLNLNYMNTDCLQKVANEYISRYDNTSNTNGCYEKYLYIKSLQDAGRVVSDSDYLDIPNGRGHVSTAECGYYIINFHYNMHNSNITDDLVNGLLQFFETININKHLNTELLNNLSIRYWLQKNTIGNTFGYQPIEDYADKLSEKEQFLALFEEFVYLGKCDSDILNKMNRAISPKIYDQLVIIAANKTSLGLKANEVMEILDITRPTLCKYVKQGLIKVDSEINGRYKYNKESVFNLKSNGVKE